MNNQLLNTVKTITAGLVFITASALTNTSFAAEKIDTKGDAARGVTAWVNNCTRCHAPRDPKELRDEQWVTTTFHMRIRAGLTGQEVRDIIAFLQASN